MIDLQKTEIAHKKYLPRELRAVVHIFSADCELKSKALPYVNIETKEIDWYGIGKNHFGSGHMAAIMWARSIWSLNCPDNFNIFERSSAMDLTVRKYVLEALTIAWGLV